MSKWRLTTQARQDLTEIWDYIAENSEQAADLVAQSILDSCETLSRTPLAGRFREDLTARHVRFWLVQPHRIYWLVYDPASSPIQILHIYHGARDIQSLLR